MTNSLIYLVPLALALGVVGLAAFFWSLKNGQYEDLDGAAERIFLEDEEGQAEDRNSLPEKAANHLPG